MTYRLTERKRSNGFVYYRDIVAGANRNPANRETTIPNGYHHGAYRTTGTRLSANGSMGYLQSRYSYAFTKARNDVIMKARSTFDDALLISDLVYARSTAELGMIYAKAALSTAKALRKGDFTKVERARALLARAKDARTRAAAMSAVPQRWLEMQFAIKPLIGTVHAVGEILDNPFSRTRVRAFSPIVGSSTFNDWPFLSFKRDIEGFYYARGYVQVKNVNQGSFMRSGISDIVGLAYDITPWSWAIDYFSNAGGYLSNLNPRYNELEYIDFCHGYRVIETTSGRQDSSPWSFTSSEFDHRRYVGLLPDIVFQFQYNLTIGRFANLMSAIALTLKGKMK